MTQNVMRKLKAGTTVAEKTTIFMSEPDVALIINLRFVDLLDGINNDVANRFRVIIDDLKITRNGKLTIEDVEDEYQKFRKIAMNNEKMEDTMTIEFATRANCLLDLNMSYGRYASHRLSKTLNEKEQALNRKLTREEILEIYREIDESLCRTVMTRTGK